MVKLFRCSLILPREKEDIACNLSPLHPLHGVLFLWLLLCQRAVVTSQVTDKTRRLRRSPVLWVLGRPPCAKHISLLGQFEVW